MCVFPVYCYGCSLVGMSNRVVLNDRHFHEMLMIRWEFTFESMWKDRIHYGDDYIGRFDI